MAMVTWRCCGIWRVTNYDHRLAGMRARIGDARYPSNSHVWANGAARRGVRLLSLRSAVGVAITSLPLWIIAWASGVEWLAAAAGLVGGGASLRWFSKMLLRPATLVALLQLGAVSLVAILNVGFVLAWIIQHFFLGSSISGYLITYGISVGDYAGAVSYSMAFCLVLAWLGSLRAFRRQEMRLAYSLQSLIAFPLRWLVLILFLISLLEIALIVSGIIGYRTTHVEGLAEGRIAWYLPFMTLAFATQIPLNSLLLWKALSGRQIVRMALTVVIGSMMLCAFIYFCQGRGAFVLCVALHFLFWCFFAGRRPPAGRFVLLLGVAAFALPTLLQLNNFLRSGSLGVENYREGSALDLVDKGLEVFQSEQSRVLEAERSTKNMGSRPLVAIPLAVAQSLPAWRKKFMLGKDLLHSAVWSIPRVFFPEKVNFPVREGLMRLYFHAFIFAHDTADSLYLASYMEYGWFGVLTHPILLAVLWRLVLLIIGKAKFPMTRLILFVSWLPMFLLSIGEGATIAWLITLRTTIMVFLLLAIAEQVFVIRRKMRGVSGGISMNSRGSMS